MRGGSLSAPSPPGLSTGAGEMDGAPPILDLACIRAREAADALFNDFAGCLTPHEYERCHVMRRQEPERIDPRAADAMLRLAHRVMGRRV